MHTVHSLTKSKALVSNPSICAESEVITDTHEDSSLLGRYAVWSGKYLPMFLE